VRRGPGARGVGRGADTAVAQRRVHRVGLLRGDEQVAGRQQGAPLGAAAPDQFTGGQVAAHQHGLMPARCDSQPQGQQHGRGVPGGHPASHEPHGVAWHDALHGGSKPETRVDLAGRVEGSFARRLK